METSPLRFYPGYEPPRAVPLARFLPPLPLGMVSGWLKEHIPAGSWVFDPLGASPALVLEAAEAGYKVLSACNNPIISFLIETMASAPKPADFQAAFAGLASLKRGDERLEKHLSDLYMTACENCGEHVPAQAFLWRKGETQPYGRLYRCAYCAESPAGERPVTPFDLERLSSMGGDRLQRVRALQRVIMNDDERRADVEEALDHYLARPLYVLFTLLNKIEGMGLSHDRLRLLHALMLTAFDCGSTLWPWPGSRSRPRLLSTSSQFREINLWQALEEASAAFGSGLVQIPFSYWPAVPAENDAGPGLICLFRGRVKTLMPLPETIDPQAVITVYPRPSQAFWTLSVLWAGWLWGPEAALPIRNVLDRRRYDWNWHTSAIFSALSSVGSSTDKGTPFFGLLPELAPGYLSAVACANQAAGFRMTGTAIRPEEEIAQIEGTIMGNDRASSTISLSKTLEHTVRTAIQEDLLARNEPAAYLVEYAAAINALIKEDAIPRSVSQIPGDLLTRVQSVITRTFADRSFLKLYGGPAEESGYWWLAGLVSAPAQANRPELSSAAVPDQMPLADQIEVEIIRFMQKHPVFSYPELEEALNNRFTGLFTPPTELCRACLESYGEPVPSRPGIWKMTETEVPSARKADLASVQETLRLLGEKMGCQVVEQGGRIVWQSTSPENQDSWIFYRMASSIISRFVLNPVPLPARHAVLVLPGSRARLLSLKLRRDPRLAEAAQAWRILKFRHLREIAAYADLTTSMWESLLDEDPLTEDARQMHLFV